MTEELENEEVIQESNEESSEHTFTEEEIDAVADTAIAALQDILKYFNVGEVTIDEYEGDEGELILDITGDDLAVLIGRHGKTLDALQFLISSITSRTIGFVTQLLLMLRDIKDDNVKSSKVLPVVPRSVLQPRVAILNFAL